MEQTFMMVKPDGVQRGLIGEIVSRMEKKGFKLVAGKFLQVSDKLAEKHYAEHVGKSFYQALMEFITSGPVFAMVWEGDRVIELSRRMIGKTDALDAYPGTIRGDYSIHTNYNLVHGSDSLESAEREINNFFEESELYSYEKNIQKWI